MNPDKQTPAHYAITRIIYCEGIPVHMVLLWPDNYER